MRGAFLGIDVGTTGAKAVLVDGQGRVLASATHDYPLSVPRPGWSEQEPQAWWEATVLSIRAVLAAQDVQVDGVGLTGQMHGLVALDPKGEVLRPAILWNDQRTAEEVAWITERVGPQRVLELTGNPVLTGFTAPKICWVRRHEPQVYRRIAHVLLPKDYVRYRLTGTLATDVADASGTSLFDVRGRRWSDEMLSALEIPRSWLPDVFESPEVVGRVSEAAAGLTGLRAGVPVVAGAGDQAAQAVGAGIVRSGLLSVTIGTSGVVFAHLDAVQVDPLGRTHTFCHAVPGKWHVMGVMLAAGGSLRWLREGLGIPDWHRAGGDPYALMTEEAAEVPPGSEGLLFLPYLSGERTPHADPFARGAFVGLTLRHRRAHFVRSVLEGVAFGLRDSLEILRTMGLAPTQVRVSGGGARSALWRQILADVFGTELVTVEVTEGAAYGAALLAAVGAGAFPSVEAACDRAVRVVERTAPGPGRERYEELYRVYVELYPRLRDAMHRLSRLS
ncbi:MAG: xylulokinase [Armatimonadota bacterium]|nr:xylulokinase [Armatimonadota bacterium]MDR7443301.1 xylulokinase [Armatimonadota bacterium]MDR7569968.1 xylulokinase [Armatimonadota bacterium]MDR7614369.1 xylulokinase [Armatimonadota bacterium]